ncbi:MAG: hypothetical protein Q4D16_03230 [Eubacteriales bacterium]|nr:hypothetical protein [Eubacteriales bacterium]
MKKKYLFYKKGAVALAMFFSVLILAGMPFKVDGADTGETPSEGTYLKQEVILPEGCLKAERVRILKDGTIRLAYMDDSQIVHIVDSSDGGTTWEEGKTLGEILDTDRILGDVSGLSIAEDGGVFVSILSTLKKEQLDPEDFRTDRYYISADNQVNILDIEGLEEADGIMNSSFTEDGKVILHTIGEGIIEVNLADGRVENRYTDDFVWYFGVAGNRLIAAELLKVKFYDIDTGEALEDGKLLAKTLEDDPQYHTQALNGTSLVMFAGRKQEDRVYYIDNNGIYSYEFNTDIMEKIVDGPFYEENTASGIMDFTKDDEGNFYVLVFDVASENIHSEMYKYSGMSGTI